MRLLVFATLALCALSALATTHGFPTVGTMLFAVAAYLAGLHGGVEATRAQYEDPQP